MLSLDLHCLMMYGVEKRRAKPPIREVNSCITCQLCKGYFIDATTIIECLHTFCRSCIVKYLESNKYCPTCDVQVHKTKPLLNIRPDKTIQDLVYKLVPKLYQNEVKIQKAFYEEHLEAKASEFEQNVSKRYHYILAPDESIDLTLSYMGCSGSLRYLRCSSAVSVFHLKKLIEAKYELTNYHKVDLFYNQDVLDASLSLMDIAYIYHWKKKDPLKLSYKIYECRTKKLKLENSNSSNIYSRTCMNNNNNNNNWKEVQLRISENGEMSITGIQDTNMLNLLDSVEKFNNEVVINESKKPDHCNVPLSTNSENKHLETCSDRSELVMAKVTNLNVQKPRDDKEQESSLKEAKNSSVKTTSAHRILNPGLKVTINDIKSGSSLEKVSSCIFNVGKEFVGLHDTTNENNFKNYEPIVTIESNITVTNSLTSKRIELGDTLNLNSELSVIPLNSNCVSLSSCGVTKTVFSTISKSMCSTKSEESSGPDISITLNERNLCTDIAKDNSLVSVSKKKNSLKRKKEETNKDFEPLAKISKPTILNHSIGLMNLSNNHPLKRHSKTIRNGERKSLEKNNTLSIKEDCPVVSQKVTLADTGLPKPIIINKNLNYLQLNRSCTPKPRNNISSGNVPCYMPKADTGSKEKDGLREQTEVSVSINNNATLNFLHTYQNVHQQPIISPAQLPHHQNLNSLQAKNKKLNLDKQDPDNGIFIQENSCETSASGTTKLTKSCCLSTTQSTRAEVTVENSSTAISGSPMRIQSLSNNLIIPPVSTKTKSNAPLGYKTLRDPPKSWNSQINSQIAKVNQNVKAQKLANAAAAQTGTCASQSRYGNDLKSSKPAKFFKGRNMPRYLGNPASGVKPMYQVHVSPEKDKTRQEQQNAIKTEKSEIKKHSIVKIDPKTLKPISEKAPETSNLSSINNNLNIKQNNHQEIGIHSVTDNLKINTSSVSIFNPLKLQQGSPRNDRKSPKSPHSPKLKANTNTSLTVTATSIGTSCSSSTVNTLSPKQQRDKTSLTFTPSNPFVPNLGSPTLNPNQFIYPAGGGFPSYDPRFMAACHSFWYTHRLAAATAAGFVPPPIPHAFGLNIRLNSTNTSNTGTSSKMSLASKSLVSRNAAIATSQASKCSNVPSVRKMKENPVLNKNEKSLETALEKITNKAKELSGTKQMAGENEEKTQKTLNTSSDIPTNLKKENTREEVETLILDSSITQSENLKLETKDLKQSTIADQSNEENQKPKELDFMTQGEIQNATEKISDHPPKLQKDLGKIDHSCDLQIEPENLLKSDMNNRPSQKTNQNNCSTVNGDFGQLKINGGIGKCENNLEKNDNDKMGKSDEIFDNMLICSSGDICQMTTKVCVTDVQVNTSRQKESLSDSKSTPVQNESSDFDKVGRNS